MVILLAGSATAALLSPSPNELPAPPARAPAVAWGQRSPGERAVHGGPIERFQDAAGCGLIDVASLPGNWTHGDYVRSVASLGDPALVPIAAHSDCGKPMVSLRGGPPAHARDEAGPPPHSAGKAKGRTRAAAGA